MSDEMSRNLKHLIKWAEQSADALTQIATAAQEINLGAISTTSPDARAIIEESDQRFNDLLSYLESHHPLAVKEDTALVAALKVIKMQDDVIRTLEEIVNEG